MMRVETSVHRRGALRRGARLVLTIKTEGRRFSSVFVRHGTGRTHSRVVCEAWSGPLFAYHRMASVRPPREPAADDDDASMQAPDVTYFQRVAAAQRSAAQHGCSAVLR